MARPRSYRSEALVLKSAPLGEGGLIVTLYTSETGKLRAVARGARKPTSKMGGHLEPLNRVELALTSHKPGGMDVIAQAQMIEGFASLKANLEGVSRGLYLAELIDGFGEEGNINSKLYSLAVDVLRFLNDSPQVELTLRYFELHLLKCSGFMPELYRCVECREELSQDKHLFSPDAGGALCLRCTPAGARILRLSVDALKVLRFLDRTRPGELSRLHINRGLQEELKSLLSVTLKYWLDREIQSKTFMEHLEHSRRAGV